MMLNAITPPTAISNNLTFGMAVSRHKPTGRKEGTGPKDYAVFWTTQDAPNIPKGTKLFATGTDQQTIVAALGGQHQDQRIKSPTNTNELYATYNILAKKVPAENLDKPDNLTA